jgi:hypothetical protein
MGVSFRGDADQKQVKPLDFFIDEMGGESAKSRKSNVHFRAAPSETGHKRYTGLQLRVVSRLKPLDLA